MTKRELYKYLERERQNRLNQLEQQENEEKELIELNIIKQYSLDSLAKSISQYAMLSIQAYEQVLAGHDYNNCYDNPYRNLLNLKDADELAKDIRDDSKLGDEELKKNHYKFEKLREQIFDSFRKLELLVQDSSTAKAATKALSEIGFDISIQTEDKEALKQTFNPEVLFGKKEN